MRAIQVSKSPFCAVQNLVLQFTFFYFNLLSFTFISFLLMELLQITFYLLDVVFKIPALRAK